MEFQVAASPAPERNLHLPLRLLGDERLAKLVSSGNEAAFATLYERHHQALYRYCRSLVGSDPDAQDALQSAMAGALVALRDARRDAPVKPWLFRIAHNESISLLRRRRAEPELPEELPGTARSPHEVTEQRARLAELVSDLHELPERQRGALVMRELTGLSHEEVAQAFGITVGAAKQTVFEARRSLMEFSEGRAMACEDIRRLISDGDGRALRGRRVRSHLRGCAGCTAFSQAIPARRADLMALAPVLPAMAATGLLLRVTGGGTGHGTAGGSLLSGVTGKAVALGISGKTLATGAAIVVVGTVGTTGALQTLATGPSTPATVPAVHHSASSVNQAAAGGIGAASGTAHRTTHKGAPADRPLITRHSAQFGRSDKAHGHLLSARGRSSSSAGHAGLAPGQGGTTAPGLSGQVGSGAGALHNNAQGSSHQTSTAHGRGATRSHSSATGSHHSRKHHHHRHHAATGSTSGSTSGTSTSQATTPTTPAIPSPTRPTSPTAPGQTHTAGNGAAAAILHTAS